MAQQGWVGYIRGGDIAMPLGTGLPRHVGDGKDTKDKKYFLGLQLLETLEKMCIIRKLLGQFAKILIVHYTGCPKFCNVLVILFEVLSY